MTARSFIAGLILLLPVTSGCAVSNQGSPVRQGMAPIRSRLPMGYVIHRDRQHDVRDLMDEAYRKGNDDPFVRNFDPQTVFAREFGADASGRQKLAAPPSAIQAPSTSMRVYRADLLER